MSYVCIACQSETRVQLLHMGYDGDPREDAVSVCCEAPIEDADTGNRLDAADIRERWAEEVADMEYDRRYR